MPFCNTLQPDDVVSLFNSVFICSAIGLSSVQYQSNTHTVTDVLPITPAGKIDEILIDGRNIEECVFRYYLQNVGCFVRASMSSSSWHHKNIRLIQKIVDASHDEQYSKFLMKKRLYIAIAVTAKICSEFYILMVISETDAKHTTMDIKQNIWGDVVFLIKLTRIRMKYFLAIKTYDIQNSTTM